MLEAESNQDFWDGERTERGCTFGISSEWPFGFTGLNIE